MITLILLTLSISTYDSTRQFNALAVPSFYMCIVHISVLRLRGDKVRSPTLKFTELKICVCSGTCYTISHVLYSDNKVVQYIYFIKILSKKTFNVKS